MKISIGWALFLIGIIAIAAFDMGALANAYGLLQMLNHLMMHCIAEIAFFIHSRFSEILKIGAISLDKLSQF